MKVYMFTRAAIVTETHQVEADTEAEAFAAVEAGNGEIVRTDFVDWFSDDFTLKRASDAEEATP